MDQRGGSEGKSGSNQVLDIRSRSWVYTGVSEAYSFVHRPSHLSSCLCVCLAASPRSRRSALASLCLGVSSQRAPCVHWKPQTTKLSLGPDERTLNKCKKKRSKNRKSFPWSTRCCHLKQRRETISCDTPTSCRLQLFETYQKKTMPCAPQGAHITDDLQMSFIEVALFEMHGSWFKTTACVCFCFTSDVQCIYYNSFYVPAKQICLSNVPQWHICTAQTHSDISALEFIWCHLIGCCSISARSQQEVGGLLPVVVLDFIPLLVSSVVSVSVFLVFVLVFMFVRV